MTGLIPLHTAMCGESRGQAAPSKTVALTGGGGSGGGWAPDSPSRHLQSEPEKQECSCSRRGVSQLQEGEQTCPTSAFLLSSGFRWMGRCPPMLVKVTLFTHSMDSNAGLFWRRPNRHTQKQCFTSCLGVPWSSQADTQNQPSQGLM